MATAEKKKSIVQKMVDRVGHALYGDDGVSEIAAAAPEQQEASIEEEEVDEVDSEDETIAKDEAVADEEDNEDDTEDDEQPEIPPSGVVGEDKKKRHRRSRNEYPSVIKPPQPSKKSKEKARKAEEDGEEYHGRKVTDRQRDVTAYDTAVWERSARAAFRQTANFIIGTMLDKVREIIEGTDPGARNKASKQNITSSLVIQAGVSLFVLDVERYAKLRSLFPPTPHPASESNPNPKPVHDGPLQCLVRPKREKILAKMTPEQREIYDKRIKLPKPHSALVSVSQVRLRMHSKLPNNDITWPALCFLTVFTDLYMRQLVVAATSVTKATKIPGTDKERRHKTRLTDVQIAIERIPELKTLTRNVFTRKVYLPSAQRISPAVQAHLLDHPEDIEKTTYRAVNASATYSFINNGLAFVNLPIVKPPVLQINDYPPSKRAKKTPAIKEATRRAITVS